MISTRRLLPAAAAALLLAFGAALPVAAQGPVLTLPEALARAEGGSYANRIAAGERQAAEGRSDGALRGILPTARVEGGYIRTTEPLNAFGFQLRQRSLTQASFDPDRLNFPAAIGNVNTGLVLELPLVNADAWAGRAAGERAAGALDASEEWTRTRTRLDILRAYYGAVLAAEQVRTLDTALRAAESHVRQAESAVRNGLATPSDALLARVKAGEVEAQLLSARQEAALAKRQLALAMGTPESIDFSLPDALPGAAVARQVAAVPVADSAARADVRAASLGVQAADADVRRTRYLYLPRVNAFGRLDWNDPTTPFGGKEAWTAGVMVSWSPFAGASEIAEHRAAEGRAAVARAQAEAAAAQAQVERARTIGDLELALARLDIAERAVVQARDAHRIVSRKYEGGLATVTELFDAAAVERATRLGHAQARYQVITAAAARRQAHGLDPAGSAPVGG
ncbi:MAG: TolC family protein [Gemmatimonadales bacterium]|nr:TolC family protein [Gemmatimonadales bacterium]